MIKKLRYFNTSHNTLAKDFAIGIITALLFSAFIYFEEFGLTNKLINTVFGVASLALLLYISKRAVLLSGFFIGLFWFYWIGYSFKYNGVGFLTPFVTLGFAIIYMLFFGVLALSKHVAIRAVLIFSLTFVEPFDFNWMQIELIFVESYIGIFKYQLALVLLALILPAYIKHKYNYLSLFLIVFAFNFTEPITKDAPLKIKLVQTDIKQDQKWRKELKHQIINQNIKEIQQAINEGYDLVVLPESTFPLFMNYQPQLESTLKELSHKISIVSGALFREDNKNFNVTYFFEDGKVEIAKKMVLVPFGEYVPLPKFAQKIISDLFFAGQADFINADTPTDFIIKGVKFRNAICYEATCAELYEGDVDFMIASSNNAWFSPSIEPVLQKLLMRFYARKNVTTIYHSANWKGGGIIN